MRTLLITGASSDLGVSFLEDLISRCHEERLHILAIAFCGKKKLEAIQAKCSLKGIGFEIIEADLSVEKDVLACIEKIKEYCAYPDQILHLAAPRLELMRATKINTTLLTKDFDIQLKSITMILSAFLVKMAKSPSICKVVFMLSSVTIGIPPKYMGQYTAVKYAMLGYMRALTSEFSGKPICFNAISPSMIDTQFLSNVPQKYVEMAAASSPSGENASVSDVTPIIHFLLSSESDYMSGSNLPVTNGSIF